MQTIQKIKDYRADVDGLRAIAVLSVLLFHAFPSIVRGGFVGVDIFFVISGFLICGIIVKNLEVDSFSFFEFYKRRVTRIFPALAIVLAASLVFGWHALLAEEYKKLAKHVLGGSIFIDNFFLYKESGYWDVTTKAKPLMHLWSLGIEEQFYIAFPILLYFSFKSGTSIVRILSFAIASSFIVNIVQVRSNSVAAFYLPWARAWELLLGAVACIYVRTPPKIASNAYTILNAWLASTGCATTLCLKTSLRSVMSFCGFAFILFSIIQYHEKWLFRVSRG